jgi:ABC-type phosphate transport system permease subunit
MTSTTERFGSTALAAIVVVFSTVFAATMALQLLLGALSTLYVLTAENASSLLHSLFFTFCIVGVSLCVATPVGITIAYGLSRFSTHAFKARALRAFVRCLNVIPTGIIGLSLMILSPHTRLTPSVLSLYLSSLPVIPSVVLVGVSLPIIATASHRAFGGSLPAQEEAALALGASRIHVVFLVTLPALFRPVVASMIRAAQRGATESALYLVFLNTFAFSRAIPIASMLSTAERRGVASFHSVLVAFLIVMSLIAAGVASSIERQRPT